MQSGLKDRFRVREFVGALLSYLGNDVPRVVRRRPLACIAVSGDRYSFGYSAPSPGALCCREVGTCRACV